MTPRTKRLARMALRTARRLVVAVVGGTLLLIGLAMTVLPGPALVVIPLGLAVLALEFAWARSFLRRVRENLPSRGSPEEDPRPGERRERRAGEEGEGPR